VKRTPADEVLLAGVRLAMGISVRAADEVGDFSAVQLRALTVLRESHGANLATLAQGMGVTVSTASRLVDRLIAAGLADRRAAAHTRREISLSLTRAGRAVLTRYDRIRLAELRTCLARVPEEHRDLVIEGLRMFVEAAPSTSAQPPAAS
jgi:DNA-binding MarR family transcriptional regulator